MKTILKILTISILAHWHISTLVFAQELNCEVTIHAMQLQIADPKIFKTLKTAILEFMNNTKWGHDVIEENEKIDCSITIRITNELSATKFDAQITLKSNRPVFNSSYNATLFSHLDKDFRFTYVEFDPLEFLEEVHSSNLSSILAYYAYIILGLDFDSFSPKGGTPYFQKAQSIVNTAQTSKGKGWQSFEKKKRNRYWLVENYLSPKFDELRSVLYKYHRQGLDKMYEDAKAGRKVILGCLRSLEKVHDEYPNSMVMQVFFNAKSDELKNMFLSASQEESKQAVRILSKLDAPHASKYLKILKK